MAEVIRNNCTHCVAWSSEKDGGGGVLLAVILSPVVQICNYYSSAEHKNRINRMSAVKKLANATPCSSTQRFVPFSRLFAPVDAVFYCGTQSVFAMDHWIKARLIPFHRDLMRRAVKQHKLWNGTFFSAARLFTPCFDLNALYDFDFESYTLNWCFVCDRWLIRPFHGLCVSP